MGDSNEFAALNDIAKAEKKPKTKAKRKDFSSNLTHLRDVSLPEKAPEFSILAATMELNTKSPDHIQRPKSEKI